jgi:cytochrome c oxidase cbb3-type subunit I/II
MVPAIRQLPGNCDAAYADVWPACTGWNIIPVGVIIMVYNMVKTVASGSFVADEAVEAPARETYVKHKGDHWHKWIERRPVQMLLAATVAILIGGLVEIFPMIMIDDNVPKIANVEPYTPLELEGRDIYIREGCLGCHSQMIRPFRFETERYGEYSKSGEFIYDRPFLWGSKRTGQTFTAWVVNIQTAGTTTTCTILNPCRPVR